MDCGLLEDRGFVVLKGLVSKAARAEANHQHIQRRTTDR
jgi:hypothetical protein